MINLGQLQEKQKKLIIAMAMIFVFVFDFGFLLRPQVIILGRLGSKISALSKDLKSAKNDIASRKDLENSLALLKTKVKDFGSTVSLEEELPSVMEWISRTANKTFVKITQIKPLKEEKKAILKAEGGGIYYQISILIDAQCGYHSLGKFLNELESSAVIMKVIGLEVTSNPSDSMRHLARLTLQTYVTGK